MNEKLINLMADMQEEEITAMTLSQQSTSAGSG